MVSAALQALEELYREGVEYAKAGVMLSQFAERGAVTADLLAPAPRAGSKALMQAVDTINARQGRGTIRRGTDNKKGGWTMKQEFLSRGKKLRPQHQGSDQTTTTLSTSG